MLSPTYTFKISRLDDMTQRLYSLLVLILCGFSLQTFAQLGQNILPNGGFESYRTAPIDVSSTRAATTAEVSENDNENPDDGSAR